MQNLPRGFFCGGIVKMKIKNIAILQSEINSCHSTVSDLVCEKCGKKVNSVVILKCGEDIKIVGFICCFKKELEIFFVKHPESEYIETCLINDVDFFNKKETKKKIRSGMTPKLRYKILSRDGFKCKLCGRKPPDVSLAVDHIKPVKYGGDNSESNLQTLCFDCNSGKGAEWQ